MMIRQWYPCIFLGLGFVTFEELYNVYTSYCIYS